MLKFVTLFLCVSLIWASPASVKTRALGGRIIGGDEANAAQFPFAAAIYKQTATGTYFCAGALINDQWVLTAAQCVVEAVLFTIRLGSTSLTSNDANALRLATDSWWAHPDYNPDGFQNDIGLIRFRIAITFTDYIKPISVLATTSLPQSSSVITYGWGQVSDAVAGTSDILNYVFLTTLSNEECRLAYGTIVQDNHVCVEGNYNQGTCRGDLGAPLIQYGGSSLTYHVAVASFISTNGCESTDPSGFTRTSPYVDWINGVVANNTV